MNGPIGQMSHAYLADFERRLHCITHSGNEKFIRELISEWAMECPLGLLFDFAQAAIRYRKMELEQEALGN